MLYATGTLTGTVSTSNNPYFTVFCTTIGAATVINWYRSGVSAPYVTDNNHRVNTVILNTTSETYQSSLTFAGTIQSGLYRCNASTNVISSDASTMTTTDIGKHMTYIQIGIIRSV